MSEMVAGRELNQKIAVEVMGLIRPTRRYEPWKRPDGLSLYTSYSLPAYSTDWGAMRLVVEKVRAKDEWAFTLGTDTAGEWDATFWEGDTFHDASADTAPHAICLAALQAVGALPTPQGDSE